MSEIFQLAVVSQWDVLWFALAVLGTFFLLVATYIVGYWITRKQVCLSPYSGTPLRPGYTLPEDTIENVLRFLFFMHQYDNRMFDVRKAAFCRETGRLFPNSVTWFDTIHVDWSFLQKRFPGNWVSWGSLTDTQQEVIRNAHHNLDGYQTVFSSLNPSPRQFDKEIVLLKPGPLYVDMDTKMVLGWKVVPETELEVLIVQKPRGIFELKKG